MTIIHTAAATLYYSTCTLGARTTTQYVTHAPPLSIFRPNGGPQTRRRGRNGAPVARRVVLVPASRPPRSDPPRSRPHRHPAQPSTARRRPSSDNTFQLRTRPSQWWFIAAAVGNATATVLYGGVRCLARDTAGCCGRLPADSRGVTTPIAAAAATTTTLSSVCCSIAHLFTRPLVRLTRPERAPLAAAF